MAIVRCEDHPVKKGNYFGKAKPSMVIYCSTCLRKRAAWVYLRKDTDKAVFESGNDALHLLYFRGKVRIDRSTFTKI